ncbi:MAG: 50S ribosomal protein L3 [Ignavibacterium sp.]
MLGLIGKKLGMSNIYDADGNRVPVTIIQAGPCKIVNIRTKEKNGYNSLQVGFGEKKKKHVKKPVAGYFDKLQLPYPKVLKEFNFDDIENYKIGDDLTVSIFSEGDLIKVRGRSKGKGFQGVVKRHGFGGIGMTTHGQSDRVRAPGSIGASSYPSRVFKGQRMAGRMGNKYVSVKNLKIVKISQDKNIILVKGAIPGAINSIVELYKQ